MEIISFFFSFNFLSQRIIWIFSIVNQWFEWFEWMNEWMNEWMKKGECIMYNVILKSMKWNQVRFN